MVKSEDWISFFGFTLSSRLKYWKAWKVKGIMSKMLVTADEMAVSTQYQSG